MTKKKTVKRKTEFASKVSAPKTAVTTASKRKLTMVGEDEATSIEAVREPEHVVVRVVHDHPTFGRVFTSVELSRTNAAAFASALLDLLEDPP